MNNELLLGLPKAIFTRDRRLFRPVPKNINDMIYLVRGFDLNDAKSYSISYNEKLNILLVDGIDIDEDNYEVYDVVPNIQPDTYTFVIYTSPFMKEKEDYRLYAKILVMFEYLIDFINPVYGKVYRHTIIGKFANIAPQMFAMKSLQELVSGFSKYDVLRYYDEYDTNYIRISSGALDQIFNTPIEDMLKGAAWEAFEELELKTNLKSDDDDKVIYT